MTNRTRTTIGAVLAALGVALALGTTPGQGSLPVLAAASVLAVGVALVAAVGARRLRTMAGRVGLSLLAGGLVTLGLEMFLVSALRQYENVLSTYLIIGGLGLVAALLGGVLVIVGAVKGRRPSA